MQELKILRQFFNFFTRQYVIVRGVGGGLDFISDGNVILLVVLGDIDNTTDMSINGVIIQDAVTMEMMAEKLMDFFFFGLDLLPNYSVV